MKKKPNKKYDKMCNNCIYWHGLSSKCLNGDSKHFETVRSAIFVCDYWSDHYIHPITEKETRMNDVVKLCSSCYYWHTGNGNCTNEESKYYKKMVLPHFRCTEWKETKMEWKVTESRPIRQAKHLSPDVIIKSQKDNILAMKETIKIKDEIIEQLRSEKILLTVKINENIAVESIYQALKEKYSNVNYMNKELLRAIREWGNE